YYLSKKWGRETSVDSDGDGTVDASDAYPILDGTVDFSETVDAKIGEASGLDSIESNLRLWLDASNIDAYNNDTISDGDTISSWKDLSGNNYHLS